VATGAVDAASCVVPVPAAIDAAVATSYLDRKYPDTRGDTPREPPDNHRRFPAV